MQKAPIEDLKKVIALRGLSDEHLQWIYDHVEYNEYEDGHIIVKMGDVTDYMWLLVDGRVDFYLGVGGKFVFYYTFLNDETVGGAGGLLPYSRMKTSPGNSYAVGKCRSFQLHRNHFTELEQLCPELIQRLVGYMTERARSFATQKLQQEKVSALGQLAAGIAHELNNPASAINRISAELNKRLILNYSHTELLLDQKVNSNHIRNIHRMVEEKTSNKKNAALTSMQRIEKEDEINDWLDQNGFGDFKEAAETLSEAGFNSSDLDIILGDVGSGSFMNVLKWLENLLSSRLIIRDLDDASCRISNLVGAIKSHVHMDRSNETQLTNIHKDIENALTLLGYKLRDKNIKVTKTFCSNMRDIAAHVGELNQVWTNVIDNAIFAMEKNGELAVETSCHEKELIVRIIDNGKGIPPDIVNRIFDPFFTTKKVGEGTGIGLDLVMRIIKRHNGDVKVHSVPGRTEFIITIPFDAAPLKEINSPL